MKKSFMERNTVNISILAWLAILLFVFSCGKEGKKDHCESYNFLHEMAQLPKFDSSKHSVIAKYCLNNDNGWVLLHYEQVIPLKIEMPKECLRYSFGGEISLKPSRTFFNQIFGGAGSCDSKCEAEIIKGCNGCTKDFVLGYCFNEKRDDVSRLFNKYLPIKRDLSISCDNEEMPIPVSENEYIYISGICTEEQLKKKMKSIAGECK